MGRLRVAWGRVRRNALMPTASSRSRRAVLEFDRHADTGLRRIQDELREGRFEFEPCEWHAVPKRSAGHRPIVIAPVPSRIVQRALLDVLVDQPGLAPVLEVRTSFGAVKRRGVPEAIHAAWQAIRAGAKFFVRSDIASFFVNIQRPRALAELHRVVPDAQFMDILDRATAVELEDLARLESSGHRHLFPTYELGVAQGCALSPLLGNVLLYNFDVDMNLGGVVCLRYIDDVLILGPSEQVVRQAFRLAQEHLGKLELCLYDPRASGKAEWGSITDRGFEFLGCVVSAGMVRPTRASQNRLLARIDELFDDSYAAMADPSRTRVKDGALVQTFAAVDHVVHGWGNQYSFCNDPNGMERLDEKIDVRIARYLGKYADRRAKLSGRATAGDSRRLLGVHLLRDSKRDPIVKPAENYS